LRSQILFFILLITIYVFYECYPEPKKNIIEFNREKINIHLASKEELVKLKGIGEKKAEKIIDYKNKNSLIKKEDLISIIGKKTFDNISSLIVF